MGDDAVRCWLVERTYTDKGLVTLVYATPDGERALREQTSAATLGSVTAAKDVAPDRLTPVEGDQERERYAGEAERMAGRHEPDEAV